MKEKIKIRMTILPPTLRVYFNLLLITRSWNFSCSESFGGITYWRTTLGLKQSKFHVETIDCRSQIICSRRLGQIPSKRKHLANFNNLQTRHVSGCLWICIMFIRFPKFRSFGDTLIPKTLQNPAIATPTAHRKRKWGWQIRLKIRLFHRSIMRFGT